MRWIVNFLADRSSGAARSLALGIATLAFSVLVVEVQPRLVELNPLLQLLIAAVSLGALVASLEWLLQWLRTRDVRGSWVYRSSDGNWGLAQITLVGFELAYEVQLFDTVDGVRAALAGRPVPPRELLGHTTSTFCEYEGHTVSLRYVVGRTSETYEKREGFLELVPQGSRSPNMVGYWTSTLGGRHGQLYLTRATNLEHLVAQQEEAERHG